MLIIKCAGIFLSLKTRKLQLYYQSGENHSDADLSLVNGVLEWDAGVNNVVIDLSATLSSSNLADVDSLITFVEIA